MGYVHEALKKAHQHRNGSDEFALISEKIRAQASTLPVQKLQSNERILRDFFQVKERLHALQSMQGIRTFAFTSAHPGEGVSTTVAHLGYIWATSLHAPGFGNLAGPDQRILLIDANLAQPQLADFFNVENDFGLAECLSQNISVEKMIKQTALKNLYLLSAGTAKGDLTHHFTSSRFANLLQQVQQNFGVVLVDTPPVIGHPELIALCAHLHHFVLIVKSEHTPSYAIRRSIATLEELGRKPLGIVLTHRRYYIPEKIYRKL